MWRDAKLWIGGEETGCGPMIIEKSAEDPDRYYVIMRIGLEQQRKPEGPQELKLMLTNLGYVYANSEKTEWFTRIEGNVDSGMDDGAERHVQDIRDWKGISKRRKKCICGECTGFSAWDLSGRDDRVRRRRRGFHPTGRHPDQKGSAETEDAVSVWAVGEEGGTVTADGAFERLMEVDNIIGIRINGEDLIFAE